MGKIQRSVSEQVVLSLYLQPGFNRFRNARENLQFFR